jgi:hypothetical protein
MKHTTVLLSAILSLAVAATAQNERATNVREATLSTSPAGSQKMVDMPRGSDLTITERTNAQNEPWCKVSGSPNPDASAPAVTGWTPCKPLVSASTPNADQVVYGEAVDSERDAEQRRGRKGAAQDAMRLYRRTADMFPNSPLAGEGMWRSADIRWQLARQNGRKPVDEHYMKEVIQRFPGSRWADLAAYEMLDNVLCDSWNGLPDCPTKEADAYERYAQEHPRSPKAAEALYNAAARQAAVADMYRVSNEKDKSAAAHNKAMALAQQIVGQFSDAGWKPRALNLLYKLQQNIPLYAVNVEETQ